MKNEVKGKVIQVLPVVTGTGKNGAWSRQTVVIEYENGRYTNNLALDCGGSKCEEFGKLKVGQVATFYYDVKSREYNGNWYHNINCFDWKVDVAAPSHTTLPEPSSDFPF